MLRRSTRNSGRAFAAWAAGAALGVTAATGLTVSAAGPASAATTWAEPGAITAQSSFLAVETVTNDGATDEVCEVCAAEYRQLLDIGHISGGSGDDILGITASGQLRLHPSSLKRPSGAYTAVGGGWQTYNQVTVVGDLTGDGRADLMARDTHGRLWFYASQVSLSQPFRPRVQVGSSWNVYNQLIGLDRNLDGHGDILGRTEAGAFYLYAGDGAGGYAGRVPEAAHLTSGNTYAAIAGEGHQPDFGKGLVVGRMPNGDAYVYQGRENGTFSPRYGIAFGYDPVSTPLMTSTVAFGDDGTPGLVVTTRAGANYGGMLLNLFSEKGQDLSLAYYSAIAGPGDLDGDGHADMVARDTGGHLWFLAGHANGTIATDKRHLIGAGWNGYRTIVGAGDLSGDGVADLVATTPGGAMYLYAGLANGAFASRVHVGSGWQGYTKISAPGDLTGDGKSDLTAVDSAGRLWLYPGLGNGHFGTRVEIGTAGWNSFHDIS